MKRPGPQYKQLKRAVFSLPALVLLAALVGVVGVAAWNMYQTHRETEQTVMRLQEEREELRVRKQAAQTAAAQISTNRGLLAEIRNKFSVAKPGERVIVLNDSRQQATTTPGNTKKSWWRRWLQIIWPF